MRALLIIIASVIMISCQSGQSKQESTEMNKTNAELKEEVLHIGKMHCEMCVASIEKGLESVEGVEFVQANLVDSTAVIRYDASKTNISEFEEVIEKRGYLLKNKNLEP